MRADLRRVAGFDEILNIEIRYQNFLIATMRRIQQAVGVLLQHVEVRGIVLILVRLQISEHPHARLIIEENETAKVAVELLRPCAYGNEIEFRTRFREPCLNEGFLQAGDLLIES